MDGIPSDLFVSLQGDNLIMPSLDRTSLSVLAENFQFSAIKRCFLTSGLAFNSTNVPVCSCKVFPLKLNRKASFEEIFSYFLVDTENGFDQLCFTTEQIAFFMFLNRKWMISQGEIFFSYLTKLNDQYQVVIITVIPTWIDDVLNNVVNKRRIMSPTTSDISYMSFPVIHDDLMGETGRGNVVISVFPFNSDYIWSDNMIILCPGLSDPV